MHLSNLGTSLKFRTGRNQSLAFLTIHALHYCGIGNFPNVTSEAQTNGSPKGQCQDYRIIGL